MDINVYELNDHKSLLPITISIVLHILILVLFAYYKEHHSFPDPLLEKQALPAIFNNISDIPAALHPHASLFGLPHQEIHTQKQEYIQNNQEDQPGDSHAKHNNQLSPTDAPSENQDHIDQTIIQQKNINFDQVDLTMEAQEYFTDQTESHKKQTTQRKITFIDLAQGFIENVRDEGTDWLKREGDEHKRPDEEDLKKISYLQKIIWHMQNEWHINEHKLQIVNPTHLIVQIIITILQDGTISYINKVTPSSDAGYDEFIIKGIQACSPLLPLPKHFNTNVFDFGVSIICERERKPWRVNLHAP